MVAVKVLPSRLEGSVWIPPSKSYTHRSITLASLADGSSTVSRPLLSRDTIATINACKAFGASLKQENGAIRIDGIKQFKTPDDVINTDNSGTTIRIMTSLASLAPQGYTVLTGDHSIRKRPMQPLLDALHSLGVECWSTMINGCPPIIVKAGGMKGGSADIRGDVSSQFITSILISSPFAKTDTILTVVGKRVSKPYVDSTLQMIRLFGGNVEETGDCVYTVPCNHSYTPIDFTVPGDFSSAAFIAAAGALAGGSIGARGLNFDLPQADRVIIGIIETMGAKVVAHRDKGELVVQGGELRGGSFDLSDSPDLLPVVATIALKASEEVRIYGVGHARFKETDRISVLAQELPKLGVIAEEKQDGLVLRSKGRLKKCLLDAHDDHRMFMAFCIAGLVSEEGVTVEGAESVDVSYPSFIEDLKNMGAKIEVKD
ncbi:MAG: 3-phosphoshikimate 1-carboxyvinyltransferase [Thaumarchaeota archaeon]|nr:3-phosphoshikimate 1-carboxyvinyltransferase [Nitrososphaerota archaeon]